MTNFLYTIIIYPIRQIIEFVYRVFFEICQNVGISILGVSVAVTLLCLPLYIVAEKWQEEERNIQQRLSFWVKKIKKAFKGDEQYMMLSTYYRENNYHPLMALRSSFSILIQVPFFIAAYSFLSHCPDLQERSFSIIKDMGQPDALFRIGNFSINILPILMTLINCVSGIIYSKGHPIREKIQIFGMAAIFLVVLYDSPAGLVLYWTMNNIFSLVKNIFYKLKNPIKIFYILMSVAVSLAAVYAAIKFHSRAEKFIPLIALAFIAISSPLILKAVNFIIENFLTEFNENKTKRHGTFLLSSISLALLAGIVIPSLLITSSTQGDFCYIDGYTTPLYFLYNSFLQCFGLFFFWPVCVYFLFGKKEQSIFSALSFAIVIFALINAFCFQGNYGIVSPELEFLEHRSFRPSLKLFAVNTTILLAVAILIISLFAKKVKVVYQTLSYGILISLSLVTIINCIKIQDDFRKYPPPTPRLDNLESVVHFSKTKENVLVFMLDKSAGYIIEESFKECPELYEQFTGFTFYPNTVSHGSWTIQAAAALYGGYEYTPWTFNQKRNIPMKEKHNQALSLLSFIFEENGFSCDLVDPPYPNYDDIPRYEFLDGHEKITPHDTIGVYQQLWYKENNYTPIPVKSNMIKRNFLWFSIFKMVPPILRSAVQYEHWWTKKTSLESTSTFISKYSFLDFLPELTDVNSNEKCFVFIDNESPHDGSFCLPPDFVPVEYEFDRSSIKSYLRNDTTFYATTAALKRIGEWFDFLKANDIYNNTRIIIVADHGSPTAIPSPKFNGIANLSHQLEHYNPMLMVKDFGETGTLKIDNTFMTNADVPALTLDGIVKNAKNPFTGNEIRLLTTEEKNEKCILSFSEANAVRSISNNGFKIKDTDWYYVHDNIFDLNNWKHCKVENDKLISKDEDIPRK